MTRLKTWLSIVKLVSMDLAVFRQSHVQVSMQSNRAEFSIVIDQSYPPVIYLGLKATHRLLNHFKTVPDVIIVRFDHPA